MVGMDQTFVRAGEATEAKSDVIALASGTATDMVVTSLVTGAMADFSLLGGRMSVDEGRLRDAYGAGVAASAVLSGAVPPPDEMEPLYARLSAASMVRSYRFIIKSCC